MALCIFLFSLAADGAARPSTAASRTRAPSGLITRHRVSLADDLPLAYQPRIAAMPGVKRVAQFNWFGGVHRQRSRRPARHGRTSSRTSPSTPSRTSRCIPEYQLTPDEKQAFMDDMRGAIIGRSWPRSTAGRSATTFHLESFIPPYRADRPFEFVVRAIYDADPAKYPNHPTRPHALPLEVPLRDDRASGSASAPTRSQIDQPEPGGGGRQGDRRDLREQRRADQDRDRERVRGRLPRDGRRPRAAPERASAWRSRFTILLVTANTMSMAIRERRTEIAVLKTLGLLERAGAGAGARRGAGHRRCSAARSACGLGARCSSQHRVRFRACNGFGAALELSTGAGWRRMFGFGAVIGLLSGLAPAVGAYRANITVMLRQV